MPYVRFNLEGSTTELPARCSAQCADGLLKVTITRPPSDRLVLTMSDDQAIQLSRVLRSAVDCAPQHRPHHRP